MVNDDNKVVLQHVFPNPYCILGEGVDPLGENHDDIASFVKVERPVPRFTGFLVKYGHWSVGRQASHRKCSNPSRGL